jgi:hypothetical protein
MNGPFECRYCGQVYFKKYKLDSHERNCQREPDPFEECNTCPMCGEGYDSFTDHLAECDPNG